jgi:hypothetical protein
MPPMMRPPRQMAREMWRRSKTSRTMYSLGIFGSCREKMFFRAISAVMDVSFPSLVYV